MLRCQSEWMEVGQTCFPNCYAVGDYGSEGHRSAGRSEAIETLYIVQSPELILCHRSDGRSEAIETPVLTCCAFNPDSVTEVLADPRPLKTRVQASIPRRAFRHRSAGRSEAIETFQHYLDIFIVLIVTEVLADPRPLKRIPFFANHQSSPLSQKCWPTRGH
jgi:hypothetical protein